MNECTFELLPFLMGTLYINTRMPMRFLTAKRSQKSSSFVKMHSMKLKFSDFLRFLGLLKVRRCFSFFHFFLQAMNRKGGNAQETYIITYLVADNEICD